MKSLATRSGGSGVIARARMRHASSSTVRFVLRPLPVGSVEVPHCDPIFVGHASACFYVSNVELYAFAVLHAERFEGAPVEHGVAFLVYRCENCRSRFDPDSVKTRQRIDCLPYGFGTECMTERLSNGSGRIFLEQSDSPG